MLTQFKTRVLLHIALLVFLLLLGLYLIRDEELIPVTILVVVGVVVTIFSLFRLVNRTNKHLANFLMSIKYDDFEQTYTKAIDEDSEKVLFGAFNLINGKFRNIRMEKEMQYHYFQSLVEQVGTGLIGFNDEGRTIFMNRALKQLLHKSYFPTFESIRKYDGVLFDKLDTLQPGHTAMYKRQFAVSTIQVAVQTTQIKMQDKMFSFFSFQDIHAELQEHEVQSWQKLIRILTHEIMNSVTPVVSLAHATNDLLENGEKLSAEARNELHAAIRAIQKRSEGLMHFTQAYRQLTKLPDPQIEEMDAVALMDRVVVLMTPLMQENEIVIEKKYGTRAVKMQGDSELLEQALINLFKNAAEAMSDSKERLIKAEIESLDGKVIMRVTDSGPGIPDEMIDQIFIPFYTSKEAGSGIGLSLSRQIVQLHGGTLTAYSPASGGAEFAIRI